VKKRERGQSFLRQPFRRSNGVEVYTAENKGMLLGDILAETGGAGTSSGIKGKA